jgi:glycerophosphoryl diester phosphodiesterase
MNKNLPLFLIVLTWTLCSETSAVKYPIVIAHRGASGYLPEHTLEAKVAAYFMGSDYLEQDVVLTKDNQTLVLHDIYLDEVTNVAKVYPERRRKDWRFYAIDFTLAEIKGLKATERFKHENPSEQVFKDRFPAGKSVFQLNSLEEEIELVQGLYGSLTRLHRFYYGSSTKILKPGLHVEIKQPDFHKREGRPHISEIVLEVLAKYNYKDKSDKVFIQCFDPAELERIRIELKSNLTLVQLLGKDQESDGVKWTSREGLERIKKFADGIGPEKDMLVDFDTKSGSVKPSQMYKDAKSLGLFLHPYTFRVDLLPTYVTSYRQLLKIFIDDLEVDGLFSDFPDLTLDYIKSAAVVYNINPTFFLVGMLLKFVFDYVF